MESQFTSDLLQRIESCGIVAVLVIDKASDAVPVAKALLAGGVDAMELTLRTPAALESLKAIRGEVPEMLAGIGTILTAQQIAEVVEAGAAFGVSPGTNPVVIREAQQAGLPFAPGVVTPSDIEVALDLRCRELKFFPAEPSGGLPYLQSMAAPYLHLGVRFVPLGGVNAQNLKTYLADPLILAVGGSWLAPRSLIEDGQWDSITQRAQEATLLASERVEPWTTEGVERMKVVTFGEVMGRLSPPGHLRLRQTMPGSLDITFAGAEANVAASLAMLGRPCGFVTALPRNPVADACVDALKARNIDTNHVVRTDDGRVGLYFVEAGANQRPSLVVYDREHSAISQARSHDYAWTDALRDAGWLHVTGITPAISSSAAESTIAAVTAAKAAGLTVSCDLNFRKKLWRWNPDLDPQELAESTMRQVLPHVDLVVANEEDCSDVLGIEATDTDVQSGQIAVDRYPDVAKQLIDQFPNVSRVGITLRESLSASHNNWGGMLYDREHDQAHFAPLSDGEYRPYEIRNIVDRVGAGDAFSAGLIYSFSDDQPKPPADAVRFAVAASCLAHSVVGDFNFSSLSEIEALMGGSTSGRVVR